jgi:hypothetical protein
MVSPAGRFTGHSAGAAYVMGTRIATTIKVAVQIKSDFIVILLVCLLTREQVMEYPVSSYRL